MSKDGIYGQKMHAVDVEGRSGVAELQICLKQSRQFPDACLPLERIPGD